MEASYLLKVYLIISFSTATNSTSIILLDQGINVTCKLGDRTQEIRPFQPFLIPCHDLGSAFWEEPPLLLTFNHSSSFLHNRAPFPKGTVVSF